jgi:L-fucose isomerase-like protein
VSALGLEPRTPALKGRCSTIELRARSLELLSRLILHDSIGRSVNLNPAAVTQWMVMTEPIILVASGDLRLSANRVCWPAQQQMEEAVIAAVRREGREIVRGHQIDPEKGHGFLDSQKHGLEVFRRISPTAPLVVAEAVWQYTHHVLPGLLTHRGPILTVANWSGQWPGLVGMLNLNASLTKAGVKYSTLWSTDFTDDFFLSGLRKWLAGEQVVHDSSHVRSLKELTIPARAKKTGTQVARELKTGKAIMGIFDEGCMGMYNAIIPDELLNAAGVFKERLSQSALYAAMRRVPDDEARAVRVWLDGKGMRFLTGPNPDTDLTDEQILEQCKMYVAALRIADEFGCDTIGIQYQQGLKDLVPASDLVEGLLNNSDRPPVKDSQTGRILYENQALPHFNEVDECAGLDALVTNRIWRKLGFDPATTLHDVRYGETYRTNGSDEFVWLFEISGSVPPSHLANGYAGAVSERQPAMYFPLGGGSLKGISKPGEIVWSRIFVEKGKLKADLGRAKVVELPREETERRWRITTPQWPVMNAVMYGVTRDQFMGRHKANHIQVAYGPDAEGANLALAAKAAAFKALGMDVGICGDNHGL